MLDREYDTMRSVEDDYWWYRVLRGLTCRELARAARGRLDLRILDAGCGTGGTMESIQRDFPGARLSGFDVSPVAVGHTRTRGFGNAIEANVHLIPCTDLSHDAVVSLDLLYHEGVDQEQAMREFWRVLVPGGRLIMNLPAFECLRGQHDVAVKNARRYSPRQVRELHQRHGFTVERLFCWNAWLFLPVLLWRKMSRKIAGASNDKAKSDLSPLNPALNRLLSFAGEAEAALCRAVRSPLGTSVFSVAIKNEIR